jgi:dimethylargininase
MSAKLLALTHVPSPRMQACQRTFVPESEIDYPLAARQHERCRQTLRECGAEVIALDCNIDLPDCTFIEDTAIVLDEVAIIASMGPASRRTEPEAIEAELRRYRRIIRIDPPATLEGGDVLRIGKKLLVGLSARTNQGGIDAIRKATAPFGYETIAIPVHDCLHLKTACTALPDQSILVNPNWVDPDALRPFAFEPIPKDEPFGGNVALVGSTVLIAESHPQTAALIRSRGFEVRTIDISEFQKAEGGVTCLGILLSCRVADAPGARPRLLPRFAG